LGHSHRFRRVTQSVFNDQLISTLKRGVFISAGGVRSIWKRNDLEHFRKRLAALSAKVAQNGIILTEDQLRALERAREEKEAHGEIETEHPDISAAKTLTM
jgi:hypothetical protein